MKKFFRITLIISIAFLGAGVLFVLPAKAVEVDELIVEYSFDGGSSWLFLSEGSLFSETNFLPGQSITRLVRVTNNSAQTQRIAVEAINQTNIDNLASQLDIIIKEVNNTIYSKTLKQFFDDGEIYLSSLAGSGGQTQYNFNVSFKSGANNDYQGKSAGFDLLVGFEGTEGGLPLPSPGEGTSGGGGTLPPGLTIYNEATETVTGTSVIITWTTSYYSTSQVIYAAEGETINGRSHTLNLSDNLDVPPYYGYARTTPEYDTASKVINHSVTIIGLTLDTAYYYRVVSHASLAISQEYSFTTLGEKEVQTEEKTETGAEAEEAGIVLGRETEKREQEIKEITEEEKGGVEEAKTEVESKQELPLLAAVGNIVSFGTGNVWIIIIFSIIVLIVILLIFLWVRKKKSKQQV